MSKSFKQHRDRFDDDFDFGERDDFKSNRMKQRKKDRNSKLHDKFREVEESAAYY
jgi:hypothetical protein